MATQATPVVVSISLLSDDAIIAILRQLNPLEVINIRRISVRVKRLADATCAQWTCIDIEYRGHIPFNNGALSHYLNGSPVDIKDEFRTCSYLLRRMPNVSNIQMRVRVLNKDSFEVFCQQLHEHGTKLTHLRLSADRFALTRDNIMLEQLAHCAPGLRNITFGDGITEHDLQEFMKAAKGVTSIALHISTDRLTGKG